MNITSLSASMVETYRICGRRFYYSYALRLPRRSNPALAFGSAFHRMTEENYYQKRESSKDLPVDLLTDFFRDDLHYQDDVDWSEQSLGKTKDLGVKTVRAYQQKVAPKVQPLHVEHAWTMEVNNRDWIISGKTDLITVVNQVRETKTTGRKVNAPKPAHTFQTGVYALAWSQQTGLPPQAEIDYAYRGKGDISSFSMEFGDSLGKLVLTTFDQVAKGIQAEVWIPNRTGTFLCSRKYCDFWNQCEKDCGGEVKR